MDAAEGGLQGDFVHHPRRLNATPQEVRRSGWLDEIGGAVLNTGMPTSTKREIDFAVVSQEIVHLAEIGSEDINSIKTHQNLRLSLSRTGEEWTKWAPVLPKQLPRLWKVSKQEAEEVWAWLSSAEQRRQKDEPKSMEHEGADAFDMFFPMSPCSFTSECEVKRVERQAGGSTSSENEADDENNYGKQIEETAQENVWCRMVSKVDATEITGGKSGELTEQEEGKTMGRKTHKEESFDRLYADNLEEHTDEK